jgi:murein DD-endopeptidase MepM/ murein hydrolase activator NlpD
LKRSAALLLLLWLAACTSLQTPSPSVIPPLMTETQPPTNTPTLAPSPTPLPTATITPSPTEIAFQMCSPLEGESLPELSEILSNPFSAPNPGQDDGHHGADFAYWSKNGKPMVGLPVQSILPGKVVALTSNRPPYGHMVIVETPIDDTLAAIVAPLGIAPGLTPIPSSRLSCPAYPQQPSWDNTHQSLYVLYAHIDIQTGLKIGDPLACGQPLGTIAQVGNQNFDYSSAPHLHLETRLGPGGMVFASMAHYIGDATEEEMLNYCLWRISGVFKVFDPISLFNNYLQTYPQMSPSIIK